LAQKNAVTSCCSSALVLISAMQHKLHCLTC